MAEKEIGDLIDEMAKLDSKISRIKLKAKPYEALYSELEDELIRILQKQKLQKAAGGKASVRLRPHVHLNISDMEAFTKYIVQKKAFDLYQRRINLKAYSERIANGENIPGVSQFKRVSITLTHKD